jgi:hypothetical protein
MAIGSVAMDFSSSDVVMAQDRNQTRALSTAPTTSLWIAEKVVHRLGEQANGRRALVSLLLS